MINEIDEEKEYLARRERRRVRMLKEKRRKRRQKRMICGIFAGIIVAVGVYTAGSAVRSASMKAEKARRAEKQKVEELQEKELLEDLQVSAQEVLPEEPVTTAYEFRTTDTTVFVDSENVISTHAILVDESTDAIVASKGENDRISPASMTKVLTILVAAEQLREEDLEDTFTMTLEITDYSYVNDCSNVGFLDGEEIKVKDLFYGTILPSGGDAAVGLATYVAGSHEAFVDLMNEKLEALGISDSAHVTNCVGLYDENHYCTVYDMAVIMKAALQNDLCREVLAQKCYTTAPTEQHPEGLTISNWFLRRIEDKDTGGEVLGAKTGFVQQSGNCAVSYQVENDGTPYICVTAGSSSSWRCIYDHVEIYNRYVPGNNIP